MKVKVLVALWCPVVCDSHGLWPARLLCPWNSPGKNTGESITFPGDLPNPGIEPGSPVMQVDSLQSEPPGKRFLSKLPRKEWMMEMVWGKGRRVFVEYSEVFVFLT